MRDYGVIQSSYWTHPDIKSMSDGAKLLGAYLLTSPHTNGLGCFHAPVGYIATDLNWQLETVLERFEELFENGFCVRCEATEYVLIPNFLRWNGIANANCAKAREAEYRCIPNKFRYFRDLAKSALEFGAHWSNPFVTVLQTVAGTVAESEQNRTEQNTHNAPPRERATKSDQPSSAKATRTRFVPPTIEEVRAHITQKGYAFSAEAFIAHYESKGWLVGRQPMKSWTAACVTWNETRKRDAHPVAQPPQRKLQTLDEILGAKP